MNANPGRGCGARPSQSNRYADIRAEKWNNEALRSCYPPYDARQSGYDTLKLFETVFIYELVEKWKLFPQFWYLVRVTETFGPL